MLNRFRRYADVCICRSCFGNCLRSIVSRLGQVLIVVLYLIRRIGVYRPLRFYHRIGDDRRSKIVLPADKCISCSCSNRLGGKASLLHGLGVYRRSAVCIKAYRIHRSAADVNGVELHISSVSNQYVEAVVPYLQLTGLAIYFISASNVGRYNVSRL